MTIDEFRQSTSAAAPPGGLCGALLGLWHEARGNWEQAHACAQADATSAGSWVHAYLHRKEGDAGNASYWYVRAGKPMPSVRFEEEWDAIVAELLGEAKRRSA